MIYSKTIRNFLLLALFILSLLTVISCGSSSHEDEPQDAVWGSVHAVSEANEADITLYQNNDIVWTGVCTEGTFHALNDNASVADLRAVASNVVSGETGIISELSAYIPAYSPGDHIDINLYTTLIERYMRNYGVEYQGAESAVKEYLRIPENVNGADYAYNRFINNYFDPETFIEFAESYGDVDSYLDTVAEDIYAEGTSHKHLSAMYASSASSSFYSDLAVTAAKSAGAALGSKTAGYILSTFNEGTEASNNDILNKLDAQNEKLSDISKNIGKVEEMLSSLQRALDQAVDDILFQGADSPAENAADNIDARYDDLNTYYTSSDLENNPLDAHANGIKMIAIDASEQNDVRDMVVTMHDAVLPDKLSGKTGALGRYALSIQGSSNNLLAKYKAFEAYFSNVLNYQYKGLLLITEAVNVIQIGDAVQINNIDTYRNEQFQGYIDDEVDEFLKWVDYLVMANANYSTDIANPSQFLPDSAALVYKRADFIAQQFSSKHPEGIVIRLFGQPSEIAAFMKDKSYQIVQIDNGTPEKYGYNLTKISENSYNLKNSEYHESYTPDWAKNYLEWIYNSDSDGYSDGYSTSTVSSAKFVYKYDGPRSEVIYYPPFWNDETSWSLVSENRFFDKGAKWSGYFVKNYDFYKLSLNESGNYEYTKTSSKSGDASAYGFALYPVRHVPGKELIVYGLDTSKDPTDNSVSVAFDSKSLKTSFSTNISHVPYKRSTYGGPYNAWDVYHFEESHEAHSLFIVNFSLHEKNGDRWQVAITASSKGKYDGTDWDTRTNLSLMLTDSPVDVFPQGIINNYASKGIYNSESGSCTRTLECMGFPCDETFKMLKFLAEIRGGIDKTYTDHLPTAPKYKEDGTVTIDKILFELME